jgi:tetratricopeptide (TPR) repeat protein
MSVDSRGNAQTRSFTADSPAARAALVAAAVVVVLLSYFPLKWGFAATAVSRADDLGVARFLASTAPDDPQTHFRLAALLEKSFVPTDVDESLREYERAVALAPENYLLWQQLGHARERAGDEGAEAALRRALTLAPNYAQVRWSMGNYLVRQKRFDEGFAEIRTAVAADPKFAEPAVRTAWLILRGDLPAVKQALGDAPEVGLALVAVLVREGKFDEAVGIWNSLPKADPQKFQIIGVDLAAKLAAAGRFREAARVGSDIAGENFSVGQVTNSGFESPLRLQNAGIFDWKLTPGSQTQIAPTNGQKHAGSNSLALIFNAAADAGFPQIAQTVAVEPLRRYELESHYRSNLKTSAEIKLAIIEAGTDRVLAQTSPAALQSEWAPWNARFAVPAGVDGVTIKLSIENCVTGCTVSGTLWLDDLVLKPVN